MGSINQIEFTDSDEAALAYVRKRGYASYSSMINVRDKRVPEVWKETPAYRFGKELHSRFLERKKTCTLSASEEYMLKEMVHNLAADVMVQKIMDGAKCEVEFDEKVNGLRCFGRIDILNFAVGDLKTTKHTQRTPFIVSMDFLQAALYTRVKKLKDFYYIGISKIPPYNVMVFNVNQFPERIEAAHKELNRLTVYIKNKL